MVKELSFVLEENIKVAKEVPKILGNPAFDPLTDPLWPPGERETHLPDLKRIIEGSEQFQTDKELIKKKVESDFREALRRVEQNLSYFRKIENEK